MSRNLCQTVCYFCEGRVALIEQPRQCTQADCGIYFGEYRGMRVANAACLDCDAKYLAWVDARGMRLERYARPPTKSEPFFDLSFRSTFNDEPGSEDLPKWKIVRVPWPKWACGAPRYGSYCERCKIHHAEQEQQS